VKLFDDVVSAVLLSESMEEAEEDIVTFAL
jgi:hypothetical protein